MAVSLDVDESWTGERVLDEAFLRVAREVYAGDPEWLPEDPAQLRFLFSHHHPYLAYGKVWVGFSEKKARLAGFFDPRLTIEGHRCAYFGFWETQDEAAINVQLFQRFEAWARALGATRVYGPINFNTYGLYRLRTNDFGEPCFQGEPYNPAHYPALMQALGYQVASQYYSQFEHDIPAMQKRMQPQYEKARNKMGEAFELVALTPQFWNDNIEAIYGLSEQVFQSNFAYTPITLNIFKRVCGDGFIRKAHPQASIAAIDRRNGNIAGMFICFPSWGPLLKQGSPVKIDANTIDYLRDVHQLPRPRLALAKTAGVAPDYRNYGIFTVILYQLVQQALASGFEHYCGALVKEDNISLGMALKASIRRTYALYWKSLA